MTTTVTGARLDMILDPDRKKQDAEEKAKKLKEATEALGLKTFADLLGKDDLREKHYTRADRLFDDFLRGEGSDEVRRLAKSSFSPFSFSPWGWEPGRFYGFVPNDRVIELRRRWMFELVEWKKQFLRKVDSFIDPD